MADFSSIPRSFAPDMYTPEWWMRQNTDPVYQQQVTAEFAPQAGEEAAYAQNALRAAAESGLLGAGSDWLTKLGAAFKARGLSDPFAKLAPDALLNSTAASQVLNKAEMTPFARNQQALYERERNDINDLAARGILQSGETGYRNDRRGIMEGQMQGGVLQDVLDRIEGFNQGRLAAMNAHRDNLWRALQSAAGRTTGVPAAPGAPANPDAPPVITTPAPPVNPLGPGVSQVPSGVPMFAEQAPLANPLGAGASYAPWAPPVITAKAPLANPLGQGVSVVPKKQVPKVSGAFAAKTVRGWF